MIRTLITADKNTLSITIPKNYIGKLIEIIAFPVDEEKDKVQAKKKDVSFNAISLDTRGFKFNREEANER